MLEKRRILPDFYENTSRKREFSQGRKVKMAKKVYSSIRKYYIKNNIDASSVRKFRRVESDSLRIPDPLIKAERW